MLVDEHRHAGTHEVLWEGQDSDGRSVASGVYWIKLTSGGKKSSRQLLVTR
jgi:flagellar hook assembly protein FlgD